MPKFFSQGSYDKGRYVIMYTNMVSIPGCVALELMPISRVTPPVDYQSIHFLFNEQGHVLGVEVFWFSHDTNHYQKAIELVKNLDHLNSEGVLIRYAYREQTSSLQILNQRHNYTTSIAAITDAISPYLKLGDEPTQRLSNILTDYFFLHQKHKALMGKTTEEVNLSFSRL